MAKNKNKKKTVVKAKTLKQEEVVKEYAENGGVAGCVAGVVAGAYRGGIIGAGIGGVVGAVIGGGIGVLIGLGLSE